MPPVVSVAMCVHNGARYIVETLQSVFDQTLQHFEIIIIDDGSTDDTVDVVERHFPDPRVRIVRQRQQTLRVARPAAVAQSSGEFIAFLDHDDVWLPHKLEAQVAAARTRPTAALWISDCLLIDEHGHTIGRLSDQFDFSSLDLRHPHAHLELLRRGNFVAYPTAFVRREDVRAIGGFDTRFQYVSDYDLWLRLARRGAISCTVDALAKYRVHPTQFTQRHCDITLAEHTQLLWPIIMTASYPRDVREALKQMMFGQHRVAFGYLRKQRRYWLAARALIGSVKYPVPLRDYVRFRLSRFRLLRTAFRKMRTVVTPRVASAAASPIGGRKDIWIDGTPLDRMQAGYFHFVRELIRRCVADPAADVYVVASRRGQAALLAYLGTDARLTFHPAGWRALHWTDIYRIVFGWRARLLAATLTAVAVVFDPTAGLVLLAVQAAVLADDVASDWAASAGRDRQRLTARATRFAWRRMPAPWRRSRAADTVEFLIWRGRFRFRNARRVLVIQDLTTVVHPELHTPGNVAEFDEFSRYAHRHATEVQTISKHSCADIIDKTRVCPSAVSVMPMPVDPQYLNPQLDRCVLAMHGVSTPYVLAVGTLEPRKNLRRLVRACELLQKEAPFEGCGLLIVGPRGWDDRFSEFVSDSDLGGRIRLLGFVPDEHLPSLYHFAKAVVYPSVYEGFGLPALEAMCSSAVVLTSRSSSLPEVLEDDRWLFDPYDVEDIARTLLRALELGDAERDEYGRRNRERGKRRLSHSVTEAHA